MFCTFVVPVLTGAHIFPGVCTFGTPPLIVCTTQRISYVYNITSLQLLKVLPCTLDWVGLYNGTLYYHPKCSNYIASTKGFKIKLPSREVCKIVLKGSTLLVVGKDWFIAYDLKNKVMLEEGKGFTCPATLSPSGQLAVLRGIDKDVIVVMDLRHGGQILFTIPYRCWKDADWGKGGLALTRPGSTWFNYKTYPYGGQRVVVGDNGPYMINTSPHCEGILTIINGRDYCIDLGFVPSSITIINDTVVVSRGGTIIFVNAEGSLKPALRPLAPT